MPKSIALAKHVLITATANRDVLYVGKANNLLSLFNVILCNFDLALEHAAQALPVFSSLEDKKGVADAYYNMASVHYRKDNFHQGLEYLLKCQRLYSELGDYHNIARVNKSMGTVYEYFGDYASAETAYLNCIEASKKVNDKNSESNAYNPLSGILIKKGKIEEANEMINQGIALKLETNDRRGLGFAYYALGKVYLAKKNYAAAIRDFEKSLAIHNEFGDQLGLGMTYSKISYLHFEAGNLEDSRKAILKALEIATQTGIEFLKFKAYHRLYQLAKLENQIEQAFQYLEQYIAIKQNVINTQTQNVIKSYAAISEIENLEKMAHSQKEKTEIIERKNDELDSFFYRVSHDLKGPISSLMGLYNVARMEVKDEGSLQYLEMFNSQTQRINNIVLGLIDLTNLRNEAQKSRIDFCQLVDECVNSCFYLEKFSSVKVIKEIDNSIVFYSEWAIINTILQNLIENAIKYSRPRAASYVLIKISKDESNLIIVVEDNGEGIPESLQDNIFNMFVRGTSRHTGSGLGLYILNRAVERLKGSIHLDSKFNQGSTFTIKVPLQQ